MLAARLLKVPIAAFVTTSMKTSTLLGVSLRSCVRPQVQQYSSQARTSIRKTAREKLKDRIMAPAGDSPFVMGRGLVAGASVVGLGTLCYYGLGMSNEVGAIDKGVMWPTEVKSRIRDTYMYFGGSIAVTALAAVAASRNPAIMNIVARRSWLAIGASFAAVIGSGMVCRSIPYSEGLGAKQLAWLVHSGVLGMLVAPVAVLGGPLLIRAAWYTAGVVGALSTLAMCAPSEKFLSMGGPLAMGLGVVFVSSLGGMFLPPTTALGAGLYSISIYGGLVLFSMFLLYDTQKIIQVAENYPTYASRPYDPINNSIGIYLDTLNIFLRIAMILSGSGNRRK